MFSVRSPAFDIRHERLRAIAGMWPAAAVVVGQPFHQQSQVQRIAMKVAANRALLKFGHMVFDQLEKCVKLGISLLIDLLFEALAT